MQSKPIPVACRAALRARVAACLRAQRGDTLIEVLIAALLVALIAGSVFTGFIGVGGIVGTQRNTSQADVLAQQDQARLHSLTVAQLSSSGVGTGNQTANAILSGTTYTVTSSAKFVSGGNGGSACSTSGTANADEVATTSTVTWGNNNGGRPPVVVSGLITPPVGGSLVATAIDPNGNPLAGVIVSLSGPSTVPPLTTDASGCAVFGSLTGGNYTVSASEPGYVDANGNSTVTQTVTVVPTQTSKPTAQFQLGAAGAVSAAFTSTYNGATHPSSSDSIIANNVGMTGPLAFTTTGGSYLQTITSPSTLYPFPSPYSVYAGGCSADLPPSADQGSATLGGAAAGVPLPALILNVVGGGNTTTTTYDDPNPAITYAGLTGAGHWTHLSGWGQSNDFDGTESDSNILGDTASFTVTAAAGTTTSVQWIAPYTQNGGYAQVYLDNVLVQTVDTYSSSWSGQYKQVAYQSPTLTTGSHTLKIVVTGTNDGKHYGSTSTVAIDEMAVSVTTAVAPMSTAPHVTLTDTGCGNRKTVPPTVAPTPTTGALTDPGVPYANLTVCADDGTNHNTAVVAQSGLSFTTGNAVSISLAAGASGLSGGVCP